MTWPTALLSSAPVIHTFSFGALGLTFPQISLASVGSAAYPAANRAIFIPFHVAQFMTVTKLIAYTGTATGNNIDVGVYTAEPGGGRRLGSGGGVAQANISDLQLFDVTDFNLAPGDYYLAVALDGTTSTLQRSNVAVALQRGAGISQMASAYPLPATATFAAMATAYIPVIGLLNGRTTL